MFFFYRKSARVNIAAPSAPIARDATSAGNVGVNTTLTVAHTCSGTNRILVTQVCVAAARTISSVTYAGSPMTLVQRSAGNQQVATYYIVNPATGTNNIVVTIDSAAFIFASSASYTGAKQVSQPHAQNVANNVNTADFTTTLTTTIPGCWLVMGVRAEGDGETTAKAGALEIVTDAGGLQVYDSNGTVSVGVVGLGTTQITQPVAQSIIAITPS